MKILKRIEKFLLSLLILVIIIAPTSVKANYNVAIGNSFTFDVEKSNWDFTYGTDSSTGTGFEFEGSNHPEGTQFSVLITDASTIYVDWNMTIGLETDTGTNSGMDGLFVLFLLFYPLLISDFTPWNQAELDLGPNIAPLFFIDSPMFSNFFYQFSNTTYVSDTFTDDDFVYSQIGGSFDNTTTIAVFEWHMDMTLTNAASGHNFIGTYTWIYAFDKTTGAMKGYLFDIKYSGQLDFTVINVEMYQRVEQVGYNLPGAGGFIPGFEWFIAIPVLTLLGGITIIIKKRK